MYTPPATPAIIVMAPAADEIAFGGILVNWCNLELLTDAFGGRCLFLTRVDGRVERDDTKQNTVGGS